MKAQWTSSNGHLRRIICALGILFSFEVNHRWSPRCSTSSTDAHETSSGVLAGGSVKAHETSSEAFS